MFYNLRYTDGKRTVETKQKIKEINAKHFNSSDKDVQFIVLSEIAKLRSGNVKSGEKYINSRTKIIFIDDLGNEFQMTPSSIKNGKWSPYESGTVRSPEYHMKKIEEIVKLKGCKIKKGEKYINAKTKMIFIDKLGNEFLTTPDRIKKTNWNPPCKK